MTPHVLDSILSAAARHGAAGHYTEAYALLDSLSPNAASIPAGLLRARMLAQQGRLEEAVAQCKSMLAAHPGHPEATACLVAAERFKGRPLTLRARLAMSIAMVAVVLLSAAALAGVLRSRPDATATALSALTVQQRESEERTIRAVGEVEKRLKEMDAMSRAGRDASKAESELLRRQINTLRQSLRKLRQEGAAK